MNSGFWVKILTFCDFLLQMVFGLPRLKVSGRFQGNLSKTLPAKRFHINGDFNPSETILKVKPWNLSEPYWNVPEADCAMWVTIRDDGDFPERNLRHYDWGFLDFPRHFPQRRLPSLSINLTARLLFDLPRPLSSSFCDRSRSSCTRSSKIYKHVSNQNMITQK